MYYPLISSMNKVVPSLYTSRTTAFATATAITDTTILNALNTFDLGLISNGLDTKMKALYPFVGGTASTHKFNFMDARDLDVAFRLQFNGGWVHSSTGALPNGVNAFAETYCLNISNDSSLWNYSRTNNTKNASEIGSWNDPYSETGIYSYFNGYSTVALKSLSNGYISWLTTTTIGFFGVNRVSSTLFNGWHNGLKKGTNTNISAGYNITRTLYIGGNHGGSGLENASNRETAFSSIGDGLTDTEATTFYNLVQAMQTSLSRQV